MIKTSDTVTIRRPVAEVFQFVADVRNDPSWNPDMIAANLAEGSGDVIGVGTAFDVQFKPFMGASTCMMKVAELTPQRLLVVEGAPGAMKARAAFRFAAAPEGTTVTRDTRIEMRGSMRLMEPIARRRLQKQSRALLEALKARLESWTPR